MAVLPPTRKGFDLRAATIIVVVTRHTIIRMRVNPQFPTWCYYVHGGLAVRVSIALAVAQRDTACISHMGCSKELLCKTRHEPRGRPLGVRNNDGGIRMVPSSQPPSCATAFG
jgi:hypothetical protein